VWLARKAESSEVLLVPNIKVKMEAQNAIPLMRLCDLLRASLAFLVVLINNSAKKYD
jgi:hypothetical protein